MGSPFHGEAAISPRSGYARRGLACKMHRLLLAMIALLTFAAMLTVVAILQKDSRDKCFSLARCSVATCLGAMGSGHREKTTVVVRSWA